MIVGTQRTGTTWIRTLLDSHPSISAHGEVFLYSHRRLPLLRTAGQGIAHSYGEYIEQSISRRIMHFTRRQSIVEAYLDELYADSHSRAIGFKFMRTQARQFPSVTAYARARSIKVIHVVRANVLKTYISRQTAKLRKLAHSTQHVPVEQITIPTKELIKKLDRIASDNLAWERDFADHPYIKVIYEEFLEDKAAQLDRMFSYLSVAPDSGVSSRLVKINPHAVSDVVKNLSEVSGALKGTPYEWCLTG